MDAEAHPQRRAAQSVSRAVGSAAHRRCRQHHHHARRRQPARPAVAVLEGGRALVLYRLGQDHAARLWVGPGDGRQTGKTRQALHQRLGRRRDRLYRNGFRDRGARADPDHVDPLEQFLDGDRTQGDADLDGKIPLHRHLGRLRRHGPRLRRLRRTRDQAGRHHPGDQSAASPRPRKACRCCWSSSRPRRPRCRGRGREWHEVRRSNGFVVPAQAGTHNHRRL